MPVDFEGFRVLRRQNLEFGVLFERALQVVELVVDLGDDSRIGEARADLLRDIQRGGFGRNLLHTSVRQGDLNTAHRENVYRLSPECGIAGRRALRYPRPL